MVMNLAAVSSRFRQAREQAGLSLDELARRTGLSKTSVWEIENGRCEPQFGSAAKIAHALDVSLDWLASGVAHPDAAALRKTLMKVRKAVGL